MSPSQASETCASASSATSAGKAEYTNQDPEVSRPSRIEDSNCGSSVGFNTTRQPGLVALPPPTLVSKSSVVHMWMTTSLPIANSEETIAIRTPGLRRPPPAMVVVPTVDEQIICHTWPATVPASVSRVMAVYEPAAFPALVMPATSPLGCSR